MCCRLGCPFRNVRRTADDGMIRILIFGATGMTGTSVLSAALTCIWFRITIFTRGTDADIMAELRKKPLTRIVEGDMFEYSTVLDAMTDIDAVFFTTTYWDTMRVECEVQQGENIVRAAMTSGIKHIIYVGTPYCSLYATEKCRYLVGKEKVEALIVSSGLPYTILHLGFYYENFLSVFRPHKLTPTRFAVALPMGNVPLNCGSVLDFGQCIAKIMLRPTINIFKTIKLATAYHTVAELAQVLDDHYPNITFFDPKISLCAYRSFNFKGSQELASMFAFYQTIQVEWSTDLTYDSFSGCVNFKEWVAEQELYILEAIRENVADIKLNPKDNRPHPSTSKPVQGTTPFQKRILKMLRVENFFNHTVSKINSFTHRKDRGTDLDERTKPPPQEDNEKSEEEDFLFEEDPSEPERESLPFSVDTVTIDLSQAPDIKSETTCPTQGESSAIDDLSLITFVTTDSHV